MTLKTCVRCDWQGGTSDPTCPNGTSDVWGSQFTPDGSSILYTAGTNQRPEAIADLFRLTRYRRTPGGSVETDGNGGGSKGGGGGGGLAEPLLDLGEVHEGSVDRGPGSQR